MATANWTPTGQYSLIKTAGSNGSKGGFSCRYADIEIAQNSSSTKPAETIEGHFVRRTTTEPVTLKAGERLWGRFATQRDGTEDADPVGVYTIEDD